MRPKLRRKELRKASLLDFCSLASCVAHVSQFNSSEKKPQVNAYICLAGNSVLSRAGGHVRVPRKRFL